MTLRLILPARPPQEGKRRLAGVLSPGEREALNRAFFCRTLAIATRVIPAAACIVISRSAELLACAEARGAQAVAEQGTGLNAALDQAAAVAAADGAGAVLSLSCDMPLLEAEDLRAMIAAGERAAIVLAPDAAGTGTNALLVAPIAAIPYRYGPGSAAAHRRAAGVGVAMVERPGLACDVDTPEDLATHSTAIARLLASAGQLVS